MPVITPHQSGGAEPEERSSEPATAILPEERRPVAGPAAPAPRRRRALAAVGVAAVVVAGAGFAVTRGGRDGGGGNEADATAAPVRRTAEAEKKDLASYTEVDGTFTYGDARAVAAPADGTLTMVASVNDEFERGDVAYEINDQPVTVLWGDKPFYRDLSVGATGNDVRVLEENLLELGFDAAGALVVDGTFDDATKTAVEAWEAAGAAPSMVDGAVQSNQVLVLPGPGIVSSVDGSVGGPASRGRTVLSVRITSELTTVTASAAGRLTAVPAVGEAFETGDVAYEIDTVPVPVIVGDEPLDRQLAAGVGDGDDVEQLEKALDALGFDAGGDLEVDRTWDEATTQAVRDWEDDLGLATVDGVVPLGQYVVVPTGATVVEVPAERGDPVVVGTIVFSSGVTSRKVTATIDSADEDLIDIGDEVEVEFPDGTTQAGSISAIRDPQRPAGSTDGAMSTPFDVTLAEVPDELATRNQLQVTVLVTKKLAADATVVPSSALISTGGGVYAVDVVDGDATTRVEVEPGLFADGLVEVEGIEVGDVVVVPS